jgi:hypothetical protein
LNRNVSTPNYCLRTVEDESMAGLEVPTWDPQTALLIGTILLEAVVLYVGYGALERLLGPRLMKFLVGGEERAQ